MRAGQGDKQPNGGRGRSPGRGAGARLSRSLGGTDPRGTHRNPQAETDPDLQFAEPLFYDSTRRIGLRIGSGLSVVDGALVAASQASSDEAETTVTVAQDAPSTDDNDAPIIIVNGGGHWNVPPEQPNGTSILAQPGDFVRCIGLVTVNLPAASESRGAQIAVTLTGTGGYTIDPKGGELVNGTTTIGSSTVGDGVTVVCDGVGWWTI